MHTKPRRDHAEGALPPDEYRKKVLAEPKKKKLIDSQNTMQYYCPKNERRTVLSPVIQGEILSYLKGMGIFCFKTKATNLVGKDGNHRLAPTEQGIPDIIACIDGQFFGIEVKRAWPDKVSGEQLARLYHIRSNGGHGIVVHSLACVIAYFRAILANPSNRLEWPIVRKREWYDHRLHGFRTENEQR
jgi:hypothetical protein